MSDKMKFKCPECGREDNLCRIVTGIKTSEQVYIDEDEKYLEDSGEIEDIFENSRVSNFECGHCGYIMKDDLDIIVKDDQDMIEWIKENC